MCVPDFGTEITKNARLRKKCSVIGATILVGTLTKSMRAAESALAQGSNRKTTS
jgi:hypothetical protein